MSLAVSIAQSGSNNVTMRNRIINGNMMIDQRNAGAAVTPSSTGSNGLYAVDRFNCYNDYTSAYLSYQQSSVAPSGFFKSLGVTTTTGFTQTGNAFIRTTIEGYNVSDLAWGTASAQTITLSFWARSSVTGTFGGALRNNSSNRSYPFTYTINSTNTWEYKIIVIAGDTSGTWDATNNIGIGITFDVGSTSGNKGAAGSWASANYISATGATGITANTGATFYITGVQLEAGTTATPFEQRLYGTELALCQRYFFAITGDGTTNMIGTAVSISGTQSYICFPLPVQMRTYPTMTQNLCIVSDLNTYDCAISAINNDQSTLNTGGALVTTASGTITYRPQMLYIANASAYMRLSAEL